MDASRLMPTQSSDVLKGEIPFSGISPQEQLDQSFSRLLAYTQGKIARYHPYYRRLFRQQQSIPPRILNQPIRIWQPA